MSFADATLRMVLLGDDVSASAALRRVGANATATQKRLALTSAELTRMGHTMSKAFTLPALLVAGASVKMSTDFNSAMTRIQTQAGGSAKDVRKLSADVLALGGKVQQGPVELANSLYHLKSVGLDNAKAMQALVQSSHLAAVGNADLEETTNAVAGAWRTGIRGATSFRQSVKTLNAVIGAGNMTMGDLNEALGTGFLPTAKTFGLSLHDVGAALAVMTDEGVPAAQAATRLRMSFSLLGAPSKAANDVLHKINLSGKQLGETLRSGGLVGAIGLLRDHLKDLSKVEQSQVLSRAFGGGRSSAGIMSLVNNFDVLQKKEAQVTAGMAKFGTDVAKQVQTPQAQFHTLISELETLAVELGDKLLPVAVDGAKHLQEFVTWFSKLPAPVKEATGDFALFMAAVGPGLLVAGSLAKAFLAVTRAMQVMGLTQAATTASTKANTQATTEAAAAQGQLSTAMMKVRFGAAVAGMAAMTAASKSSNGAIKALGQVGGGALMGFAAGGPIGAAIGGAAGAFAVLSQHIHSASSSAKTSTATFSGLAGTLDDLTGAVTANTRQFVENQLAQSGTLKALSTYGITTRTAINAILGEGQARKSLRAVIHGQMVDYKALNRQIDDIRAANVAAGKAGTLTPKDNAARAAQVKTLQAQAEAEKNVISTIRNGIGMTKASIQQKRAEIAVTTDYTGKLKGIPKTAKTYIQANGVVPTLRSIAAIAKSYSLTPKQITTLIQATGVDTTVKAVKRVEAGLTGVSNVRPNLSAYKASLASQMDQAGGIARSGGASVGYAMSDGLSAALAADRARIAAQSADLVSNAINAARKAAAAHSPSRKMIALGHDLIDGLMVGIKDRWQPLKSMMTQIQQDVQGAIQRLKSDTQARNQFAGGFQSFATSAFGADYGTDASGNPIAPTPSSILAFAQQQRNQARMVKQDVRKLVKMGLSPALLRQLQAQGAAGIPEIESLAASNSSVIRQYDRLNAQTTGDLRGAGMSAAGRIYNSRIAQDQRDVHLAKAIAKELAAELRRVPDDKELVIRDANGDWIIKAVKKRNSRKGVKSAGL